MPDEQNSNPYLPDNQPNPDHLSIEIPAEQAPVAVDRIPSGYDPMGEVQLRGRVAQGIAGGRAPWWVLIIGWGMVGGLLLVLLHVALQMFSWVLLLPLAIVGIFALILGRGTRAKLADRRR